LLRRLSGIVKELDSRVRVTIVGTGVHTWGMRLTTQYNQLYALDLGANALELGFLNSATAAIGSLASIPLGWATERYSVKTVLIAGFITAAVSSALFALAGHWWMLIPAFVLGSRLIRIMPLTDVVFISVTESERRAGVMSLSRVVWGVMNIFAPILAAFVVDRYGGINAEGIRPLYYVQVVLTVSMILFMARYLQPLEKPAGEEARGETRERVGLLQSYRGFFEGERWLKRMMVLRVVRQFGMNLALPFVPLWMVNVKGASPYILGVMGTVGVATALLLQIPAGRLSDRVGRKRVYFLLRPACFLGTILMILAPRPEYLVAVGVLGAVALGGGMGAGIGSVSMTPFITMFWEMVPQEKMGRWYGIEGLMAVAMIPASLLGGYLWQRGLMMEVMVIPMLLEILVAMPLLATIPDTLSEGTPAA